MNARRIVALSVLCSVAAVLIMAARNSSGTYSLVSGPFIAGTPISSAAINSQMSDFAIEVTSSLDRNGRGGMLAPIRTPDGTVTAPAHSFTNEMGTGFYRVAANDVALAVGGVKQFEATSSGVSVAGTLGLGGPITGMTRASLPAVGQAISNSSGTFNTSSGTPVNVTNLSVSLTTSGRPVMLFLQPDGTASASFISAAVSGNAWIYFLRDGASIGEWEIQNGAGTGQMWLPVGAYMLLDLPSAAAHAYTVQVASSGSGGAYVYYTKLVAFEL